MLIWLILIAAEIVHGIVRAVTLVPLVGEFRSNQIGVFSGSAIILVIAYLSIRWIGASRCVDLFLVGAIWLVLTVAFEILFGRYVVGLSWERLATDYNLLNGGLMPIGLLVMFLAPWSAGTMRKHAIAIPKDKRL